MQFVLRTGSGYENVDERFPETSAEASHWCIAQLRTKRDLCRKKKLKKYIISTKSIAYQPNKPDNKMQMFCTGYNFFVQAPRSNSSQTSAHNQENWWFIF